MNDLIKFFEEIGRLKQTSRRGWLLRKVESPESIADHNFRLILIGWILPKIKKYRINFGKLTKMILAHDLYRLYYGDDTPYDFMIKKDDQVDTKIFEKWPPRERPERIEKAFEEKRRKLKDFLADLPTDVRKEVLNMWEEFEFGGSNEAKFARQLDRLETLLQAIQYEREGKEVNSYPFWREVKETVDHPILLEFMEEIDKYYYSPSKKK
ncbi:MAG: HD domain-containing protein [Candidatus Woykebacteria bacterium]